MITKYLTKACQKLANLENYKIEKIGSCPLGNVNVVLRKRLGCKELECSAEYIREPCVLPIAV